MQIFILICEQVVVTEVHSKVDAHGDANVLLVYMPTKLGICMVNNVVKKVIYTKTAQ
jgi:hypothetical protein